MNTVMPASTVSIGPWPLSRPATYTAQALTGTRAATGALPESSRYASISRDTR